MDELLDYHYDRLVGYCESMRGENPKAIELELTPEYACFTTVFPDGRELAIYRIEPLNTDLLD